MPKVELKLDNPTVVYFYNVYKGSSSKYINEEYNEVWNLLNQASALNEDNKAGAIEIAYKAYRLAPDLPECSLLLGEAYLIAKDYVNAEPLLKFATEPLVGDFPSKELYAQCLVGLKKYDAALKQYDVTIEAARTHYEPEDVSNLMAEKAWLLTNIGRYDEAIALVEDAIAQAYTIGAIQTKAATYRHIGSKLAEEGYLDKAKIYYMKALDTIKEGIKDFPDKLALYTTLGRCLDAQGDYEGALKAFDHCLSKASKENLVTVAAKANTYFKMGDQKSALECINEVNAGIARDGYYAFDIFGVNQIKETLAQRTEMATLVARIMQGAEDIDGDPEALGSGEDSDGTDDTLPAHGGCGAPAADPTSLRAGSDDSLSTYKSSPAAAGVLAAHLNAIPATVGAGVGVLAAHLDAIRPSAAVTVKQQFMASAVFHQSMRALDTENSIDPKQLALLMPELMKIFSAMNAQQEHDSNLTTIYKDVQLHDYYKAFVGFCTSAYTSAKAADGKMVGDKEMSGIPGFGFLSSLPLPAFAEVALGIINKGATMYQSVKHHNKVANMVALSPTTTAFEKVIDEMAIDICLSNAEQIHAAKIDSTGLLAKFGKLKDKYVVNNYKTAAAKKGLEHGIMAVALMQNGKFSELDSLEQMDALKLILSPENESKLVDGLSSAKLAAGTAVATGAKSCIVMAVTGFEYNDLEFVKSIAAKAELAKSDPVAFKLGQIFGFPTADEAAYDLASEHAIEALGIDHAAVDY